MSIQQLLLILFFTPVLSPVFGQTGTFQKTYGGSGNDIGMAIRALPNGGFIAIGTTASYGAGNGTDAYILKLNSLGEILWTKTFGKPFINETGMDILPMDNGDFAFVANYNDGIGLGEDNILMARIDSNGNLLWTQIIRGAAVSIAAAGNGDLIAAGTRLSHATNFYDGLLAHVTAAGNVDWVNLYRTYSLTGFTSAVPTADNGFIATGYSYSTETAKPAVAIIKTDSTGNLLWNNRYEDSSATWGQSVIDAPQGGYLIAGGARNKTTGNDDILLLRLSGSGNIIWQTLIGTDSNDYAYSLEKNNEDGYVLSGMSNIRTDNDYLPAALAVDSAGMLQWSLCYRGSRGARAALIPNDYIALISNTKLPETGESDILLLLADSLGRTYCNDSLITMTNMSSNMPGTVLPVVITSGYQLVQDTFLQGSGAEVTTICTNGLGVEDQHQKTTLKVFPNPAEEQLIIEFPTGAVTAMYVHDLLGKGYALKADRHEAGFVLSVASFAPGIYVLTICTSTEVVTTRFIKQ